ncbi:MAG: metallophosphoesterase [Oscillospiraceae bacterium]|jgi:hypothetical protein|nr:metallophosphoesterase [Oscillospiraceae bacterium]
MLLKNNNKNFNSDQIKENFAEDNRINNRLKDNQTKNNKLEEIENNQLEENQVNIYKKNKKGSAKIITKIKFKNLTNNFSKTLAVSLAVLNLFFNNFNSVKANDFSRKFSFNAGKNKKDLPNVKDQFRKIKKSIKFIGLGALVSAVACSGIKGYNKPKEQLKNQLKEEQQEKVVVADGLSPFIIERSKKHFGISEYNPGLVFNISFRERPTLPNHTLTNVFGIWALFMKDGISNEEKLNYCIKTLRLYQQNCKFEFAERSNGHSIKMLLQVKVGDGNVHTLNLNDDYIKSMCESVFINLYGLCYEIKVLSGADIRNVRCSVAAVIGVEPEEIQLKSNNMVLHDFGNDQVPRDPNNDFIPLLKEFGRDKNHSLIVDLKFSEKSNKYYLHQGGFFGKQEDFDDAACLKNPNAPEIQRVIAALRILKENASRQPAVVSMDITKFDKVLHFSDFHGSLERVITIDNELSKNPNILVIVTGDFGDKGEYSIEVYFKTIELIIKFPGNIIILRGNHESRGFIENENGLNKEIKSKFKDCADQMIELFCETVAELPIFFLGKTQEWHCLYSHTIPTLGMTDLSLIDKKEITRLEKISGTQEFDDLSEVFKLEPMSKTKFMFKIEYFFDKKNKLLLSKVCQLYHLWNDIDYREDFAEYFMLGPRGNGLLIGFKLAARILTNLEYEGSQLKIKYFFSGHDHMNAGKSWKADGVEGKCVVCYSGCKNACYAVLDVKKGTTELIYF